MKKIVTILAGLFLGTFLVAGSAMALQLTNTDITETEFTTCYCSADN